MKCVERLNRKNSATHISLDVAAAFSMVSLYWKPEQPPASTSRRRDSGTELAASADFRAAFIAIKRCDKSCKNKTRRARPSMELVQESAARLMLRERM